MKINIRYPIYLFIIAIVVRIIFSFYFQKFYFGELVFKYADTSSYLNPILNLINNGEYIGDKYLIDSKYFRPPVYPLMLGIFLLIIPDNLFEYSIAIFQSILGAITVVLFYYCILNITKNKIKALISGIFIALYPFTILWTPIIYTETVQIFLISILIFNVTKDGKISNLSLLTQGIVVGTLILTKQYLGLIIILPILIILFSKNINKINKINSLLILISVVCFTLSPWVIRNYNSSGNLIILFSKTSGLRFVLDDMIAFTHFANKFNENITENVNSVAHTGKMKFSSHAEFVTKYTKEIDEASILAYQCGGSFQEWREQTNPALPPYKNCNEEVASKFNWLSNQFWKEVPFWQSLESRRNSLWKIVSKSDLENKNLNFSKSNFAKFVLFKYRIILLFLGLIAMVYIILDKKIQYREKLIVGSILITAISFYAFFCLVMVQAEMRYLLTPDVLITLFCGLIPAMLYKKFIYKTKKLFKI
jgi:4-amino-4-deoxy-L-arabinose transferase-like glycosyltransferase